MEAQNRHAPASPGGSYAASVPAVAAPVPCIDGPRRRVVRLRPVQNSRTQSCRPRREALSPATTRYAHFYPQRSQSAYLEGRSFGKTYLVYEMIKK